VPLWDLAVEGEEETFRFDRDSGMLAFSADGSRLYAAGGGRAVRVCEWMACPKR
jgi:hypothetical protein